MQNEPTFERKHGEVQTKPLTKWEKEPDVLTLQKDLAMARQWNQEHVSRVDDWLNMRNIEGKYRPKVKKNQSSVQPKLIRRQAEWRYSALSEPFLSSEKMFTVSPETWEDVKAARQNEMLLNYQFRTKLNPVKFIDEYVRTTVDEGTCIIRLGWKRETKQVETEVPIWNYMQVEDPQFLEQLQQAIALKTQNPQGFEDLPEEMKKAVEYTLESQIPVMAMNSGETTMVTEEKVIKNHPTLDILHYKNVFLDPSCEGDISKASFAILSFETSKAELMKDGRYTNLEQVLWSSQTPLHQPDHASNTDDSAQFEDELRKRVVAYEYWGWYDVEGNGVLTPIVATWIGNVMIRMEENPFPDQELPLVIVPYLPIKRSVTGEPDAELLQENQAILGAVTRGMIDLMGRSANGQTGFAKGTLDVVNRRRYDKGDDYEFNPGSSPQAHIFQHTYPEIPNSAMNMLGLQNQEAESLSGVKAFSGGLSGEAYGDVAAGIKGMLDASAKREMSILRRLAQGMEEIGRKMAAMNAAFLEEDEVVQVTNEEFVKVSRDDLMGEFNYKVDIATSEVDESKAQDLGFMLQTLGNTVPWEITQSLLAEIARLKRMPALEHKIQQFKPEPDPVETKMKELEVAKLDAEINRIRSQTALDQAKAQSEIADARKVASEADLKDLDFVEQETGTKHERDMDRLSAQASANQDLEITKRILAPEEGVRNREQGISEAIGFKRIAPALTP